MCLVTLLLINGPMLKTVQRNRKYLCPGCGGSATSVVHTDKVFCVMALPLKNLRRGTYCLECESCGHAFWGPKYRLLAQMEGAAKLAAAAAAAAPHGGSGGATASSSAADARPHQQQQQRRRRRQHEQLLEEPPACEQQQQQQQLKALGKEAAVRGMEADSAPSSPIAAVKATTCAA